MTKPGSVTSGAPSQTGIRGAAAAVPHPSAADAAPGAPRAAYAPPVLERLGAWRALTLQQSVPIFP